MGQPQGDISQTIDVANQNLAIPNVVSPDSKYRRHEFLTWQGWYQWADGWDPGRVREAVQTHKRGWPYMSAALAVDMLQNAEIHGAWVQRSSVPLRTSWRVAGPSRAPRRYARDDLQRVWDDQFRPQYEDFLFNLAFMGGQWIEVHWELDAKNGVETPRLKRWPWEATIWRPESPAFRGGWYAITVDSGIVRMVPGDGHWLWLGHGQWSHQRGAVVPLGMSFMAGELALRDEANLSSTAGRASLAGTLPEKVQVDDPIGIALQNAIADLGIAATGIVVPFGTELKPVQVSSDTTFFATARAGHRDRVALSLLGQASTLGSSGPDGTYKNLGGFAVSQAIADRDHEATVRGFQALIHAYEQINGNDAGCHLVGERYADCNDAARNESSRATMLGTTVLSWRQAGLDPTQDDVDSLASKLTTKTIKVGAMPKTGGTAPNSHPPSKPPAILPTQSPNPAKPTASPQAIALDASTMARISDFLKAWDESQHPRDKGRFATKNGSKAPKKGPASPKNEGPKKPSAKKDGLGTGKAAAHARIVTGRAASRSETASDTTTHKSAARAHAKAARAHQAAATASIKPEYKAAHQRQAELHAKLAKEHTLAASVTKLSIGSKWQVGSVETVLPKSQTKAILSLVEKSPIVNATLKAHPLGHVVIHPMHSEASANGKYTHKKPPPDSEKLALARIEISTDAASASQSFKPKPLKFGTSMKSISQAGKTPEERMRATFAHEIGHHLQFASDSYEDAKVAFRKGKPVTRYAAKNPREYFAESYASYVLHRDAFKAYDPIGHAMIERALKNSRVI